MADFRTHDPAEGNDIAKAVRAAMGEPVRPVPPGEKTPGQKADEPSKTTWVAFTAAPSPKKG